MTTTESHPGRHRQLHGGLATRRAAWPERLPRPPAASGGWLQSRWLLLAVLAVQALLSLRLLWSNTASVDEGEYLSAGHAEIAHWLHGTFAPAFQLYFSGAPVLYPPLGAAADAVGGLVAARLVSLCFMLVCTGLVWIVAGRLVGRRSAPFAAALFALQPGTAFLGAYATFDAMALMLLAAAAWCAVRGGPAAGLARAGWLAGMLALLLAADATKYAATIFDPVVLVLAALAVARVRGVATGARTLGLLTACAAAILVGAYLLAGADYRAGIDATTLHRPAQGVATALISADVRHWVGWLAALAVLGAIGLSLRDNADGITALTGWSLAAAAFLAPAEQLRIHTVTSLFKHVDFGAWFAAVPAGYAISALLFKTLAGWPRRVAIGVAAAIIAGLAAYNATLAATEYHSWPNSTAMVARLRPLLATHRSPWLAEDYTIPAYSTATPLTKWWGTRVLPYRDRNTGVLLHGTAAYLTAIRQHYFSVVVLDFANTATLDQELAHALDADRSYRLVASIPEGAGGTRHYLIWVRRSGSR